MWWSGDERAYVCDVMYAGTRGLRVRVVFDEEVGRNAFGMPQRAWWVGVRELIRVGTLVPVGGVH